MSKDSEYYRHLLPKLHLSIEKYTKNVPNDGKYHIVKDGIIIANYRKKKEAEERFYEVIRENNYKFEDETKYVVNSAEESIERYLMAKDVFWAEGPKYKSKGGRGGRGGV